MTTPSLAASLNLNATTAEHPRDAFARMLASVKARRVATGATLRTASAANEYRNRAARIAERALANHPKLAAVLARIALVVGPDAPDAHAIETIKRAVETRATIATLAGADHQTIAAALSRLASKGTDAGAPARLAVTIPAGLSLPDWIAADGGTWYHVPHLAPGRYQYTTRTVAQLTAWADGLATRDRERALPIARPEQSSRLVHNALRIEHARDGLNQDATAAAVQWDTHNRAADKLEQIETEARAIPNPHDARRSWERANGIARGMVMLRATLRDKAGTLMTARGWIDRASYWLPGDEAPAYIPSTKEGRGGMVVYSPALADRQ